MHRLTFQMWHKSLKCSVMGASTLPWHNTIIGGFNDGENWQLITDEPVEFEKSTIEVQDCKKFIDRFRGICKIYPNLRKENQKMSRCNRLDLGTLGYWLVTPKNLPGHWVYPDCRVSY